MDLESFDKVEREVAESIDWTKLKQELNTAFEAFDVQWVRYFARSKDHALYSGEQVAKSLSELANLQGVDKDIRQILLSLASDSNIFYASDERDKLLSEVALRIFETFRDTILKASSNFERGVLLTKIILFSSPTEILTSLMSQYADIDSGISRHICGELVKISQHKYPLKYTSELNEMELFQVTAPFLRSIIFSEQMQVVLILANSLREYLEEVDPSQWLKIAPIFKLCLNRHTASMNLSTASLEDAETVSDFSIKNLLGGHEDLALDATIDLASMPNIIFRRYQERTANRVAETFLAIVRDITSKMSKIKDVQALSNATRYVQDCMMLELGSINSNCLLFSELSGGSFNELVVVTIDKIRERVAEISEDMIEISMFDQVVRYDLLPQFLADQNLVEYVDGHADEIAMRQMQISRDVLSRTCVSINDHLSSFAQFTWYSPYRIFSTLNWVDWRDAEPDVQFDKERGNFWSDPLFKPAFMLSWVLYKELTYNKLLVRLSS